MIDGGTCGMEMLEELEGLDALIMVDADSRRCSRPGRRSGWPAKPCRCSSDQAVATPDRPLRRPGQPRAARQAPRHTAILGLQPQSLALGMELSREVEDGMPELLRMVVDELATLGIRACP
jgi:hydrogenase maturation protease